MNEDRYIQIEEDVYIDIRGGLTPPQRAWIAKVLTYCIGTLALAGLVSLIFPTGAKSRDAARRASCQSNLKQIALGIQQYTQDNDNHYPLVAVNNVEYFGVPSDPPPYGWVNALYPYLKSSQIFHCPSGDDAPTNIANPENYSDYWFNRHLSRAPENSVERKDTIFMMGDGVPGNDPRSNLSGFPNNWLYDQTSPLWRHSGGANYAFADGHVKWLSGDTAYKPGNYHFEPQGIYFAPR